MILEIHDTDVGNSLAGRVNHIDYDYQAEQWVQDIVSNEPRQPALAEMILMDDQGPRAKWKIHEDGGAQLIERSPRFTGEWQLNTFFYFERK